VEAKDLVKGQIARYSQSLASWEQEELERERKLDEHWALQREEWQKHLEDERLKYWTVRALQTVCVLCIPAANVCCVVATQKRNATLARERAEDAARKAALDASVAALEVHCSRRLA